jgi:hypothetical protein
MSLGKDNTIIEKMRGLIRMELHSFFVEEENREYISDGGR